MLRFKLPVILFGIGILLTGPARADEPVRAAPVRTLKEAYVNALKTSERITISEEALREAEALYRRTLGSSLPELSYRRTADRSQGGSMARERMFRISKTNLTGYRELAEIRADSSTVQQRSHERRRAEQLLLADISVAYYNILQARENITATRRLVDLSRKRLDELQKRVRVGRTREADAIEQEYQISTLESQLEESERLLDSRSNLLEFLVGAPVTPPDLSDTSNSAGPRSLERYLAGIDTRPDIRAARENVESVRALVDAARADRLPQLDATANYYTDRPKNPADWDVSLGVKFPIWDGGSRKAAVDAAESVLRQKEAELKATRRSADLEIRNAYHDYASARKQMVILRMSVDLARRDYEEQARDDRQGLVTSLEVIESLNRLNSAELSVASARVQERLTELNLEIAAGANPEEILK